MMQWDGARGQTMKATGNEREFSSPLSWPPHPALPPPAYPKPPRSLPRSTELHPSHLPCSPARCRQPRPLPSPGCSSVLPSDASVSTAARRATGRDSGGGTLRSRGRAAHQGLCGDRTPPLSLPERVRTASAQPGGRLACSAWASASPASGLALLPAAPSVGPPCPTLPDVARPVAGGRGNHASLLPPPPALRSFRCSVTCYRKPQLARQEPRPRRASSLAVAAETW